ncbi:MAG: hypothetical protein PHZ19_09450 [Candidatus Thermoplasmatota archaeon]|nr:hypothetical protein [Candidatus Thermoplasmatota archaeon]
MANATPQAVVEKVVSVLRNNLTDINTRRAERGGTFVFDDFPHDAAASPRVGVMEIDSPWRFGSIPTAMICDARLEIVVVMDASDKFDYNNDGVAETPEQCCAYVADQVMQILHDNMYLRSALSSIDESIVGFAVLGSPRIIRSNGKIFRYIDCNVKIERGMSGD